MRMVGIKMEVERDDNIGEKRDEDEDEGGGGERR